MKFTTLFLLLLMSSITLFSQDNEDNSEKFISKKNDHLVISFLNCQLNQIPNEMNVMPVSLGFEAQSFLHLLKKGRTLNFSIGLGISTYNIHNNSLPYDSLGITYFKPIPGGYEYIKNKLTVSYIEVPLEIDMVSKSDKRNRNLKVALGGKFGFMLTNYIKYTGEDFRNQTKQEVKFKEYNFDNINKLNYGVYGRITYGRIGFNVSYYLSNVFNDNHGPETKFLSYGVCISI